MGVMSRVRGLGFHFFAQALGAWQGLLAKSRYDLCCHAQHFHVPLGVLGNPFLPKKGVTSLMGADVKLDPILWLI